MSNDSMLIFPRAFAFAIDDLGWNEGSNLLFNTPPGPYRAGVKRTFSVDDYRFILNVGKSVGVRIQCLFILSEMDRENVLAKYPTTTHQREKWNNSHRVNDEQLAIMKYVCDESSHMEFGLHGTGHEYWAADGIQRRAEWYNMVDRVPWPEQELRGHVQAFREIMAQYGLTPEQGHSFPESFVPCAYSYYWNPNGPYSLGKLVSEAGVKYANTDFTQIPELSPPKGANGGGFDNGVHVINRMNYGNVWHELDMLPRVTLNLQETDVAESHWSNWLAQDDFLQPEVTSRWIGYYRHVQRYENRYIAKNTEQLHSQWLYQKYASVKHTAEGVLEIDNTRMPAEAYHKNILGNMVFKIKCSPYESVNATINGAPIPAYFKDEGFVFLYLPPLEQKKYELNYTVGRETTEEHVFNDGTYNVYALQKHQDNILVSLKMYGQQFVKVKCDLPTKVISLTKGLIIEAFDYDAIAGMANINTRALDFQGIRGQIRIQF